MVIDTVVMMNLFPLPGYGQYLALSWVELHLPVFSPDIKCIEVVLNCITVRIRVYYKVRYGVVSKKLNGRLEFFMDVVHVIKEQARS